MNFSQWLKENGYDEKRLSAKQRAHLESAYKAETAPPPPVAKPVEKISGGGFKDKMDAIEAEASRQSLIREAVASAAEKHVYDPEKVKQLRELGEAACADEKMTLKDFQLSLLRLDRMLPAMELHHSSADQQRMNASIIEASICKMHGLPNMEKHFSRQTLELSDQHYSRGIGLIEVTHMAAERNGGYRGSRRDIAAMCRHAYVPGLGGGPLPGGMRADVGPSTINVPGILSNVANKFLLEMFLFSEQAWRQWVKIKTATDFKTMSEYRLTGNNKFTKVPPGQKLEHGTLGELSYTNKVDLYGKMLGIGYQDYINDDLGAFTRAASDLARGGSDSLNEVIYTEFLDDSAFFPTDKSLGNYDDGATDSVLSLAGLENADAIFAAQTKPDGTPLGVRPRILLVPRGLRARGMNLMSSQKVVGQGQSAAEIPDGNPWQGMFNVVDSIYLGYSSLGGSTTAWYLLADPNDVAVLEVAFLFGRDTPTVEMGQFNFDQLGLAMRAYMSFGAKKQEYRGGTKLKGAA